MQSSGSGENSKSTGSPTVIQVKTLNKILKNKQNETKHDSRTMESK